jgi:hypothetical protein
MEYIGEYVREICDVYRRYQADPSRKDITESAIVKAMLNDMKNDTNNGANPQNFVRKQLYDGMNITKITSFITNLNKVCHDLVEKMAYCKQSGTLSLELLKKSGNANNNTNYDSSGNDNNKRKTGNNNNSNNNKKRKFESGSTGSTSSKPSTTLCSGCGRENHNYENCGLKAHPHHNKNTAIAWKDCPFASKYPGRETLPAAGYIADDGKFMSQQFIKKGNSGKGGEEFLCSIPSRIANDLASCVLLLPNRKEEIKVKVLLDSGSFDSDYTLLNGSSQKNKK